MSEFNDYLDLTNNEIYETNDRRDGAVPVARTTAVRVSKRKRPLSFDQHITNKLHNVCEAMMDYYAHDGVMKHPVRAIEMQNMRQVHERNPFLMVSGDGKQFGFLFPSYDVAQELFELLQVGEDDNESNLTVPVEPLLKKAKSVDLTYDIDLTSSEDIDLS